MQNGSFQETKTRFGWTTSKRDIYWSTIEGLQLTRFWPRVTSLGESRVLAWMRYQFCSKRVTAYEDERSLHAQHIHSHIYSTKATNSTHTQPVVLLILSFITYTKFVPTHTQPNYNVPSITTQLHIHNPSITIQQVVLHIHIQHSVST